MPGHDNQTFKDKECTVVLVVDVNNRIDNTVVLVVDVNNRIDNTVVLVVEMLITGQKTQWY